MNVKTFENINALYVKEQLEYLLALAREDTHNRYKKNYTTEMMQLNFDYLGISFAYDDNDVPFAFSTIQRRDCYNGMVRLLSRFYQYVSPADRAKVKGLRNPVLSFNKKGWIRDFTAIMLDQQVDLCDNMKYHNNFISRQDKSPAILTRFLTGIHEKCRHTDWNQHMTKHNVCPGAPEDCAQYILWRGKLCLQMFNS